MARTKQTKKKTVVSKKVKKRIKSKPLKSQDENAPFRFRYALADSSPQFNAETINATRRSTLPDKDSVSGTIGKVPSLKKLCIELIVDHNLLPINLALASLNSSSQG